MQPMNYTIQTGNPGDAFADGMQRQAGIMATVADYQKAQALATAAQQKAEAEAYKRQRFQAVAQNPTSKEVQSLMLEFPELHEGLGKSLEFMSADEKKNTQQLSFSVLSALEKDKVDTALQTIDLQLEAAKKANDPVNTERLEVLRNAVIASPDGARFALKGLLFSTMGGKDYGDLMKNLEAAETDAATRGAKVRQGEADATKTEAEAVTAQVKAKFAESDAAMELQEKGWNIKKIQADIDIAKQNSRIAAMNAQTSRMGVGLQAQKLQLDLQEAIAKRDATVREKVSEAETTRASMDNLLGITDKILKTPKSVVGSAAGPISSKILTVSQSTADFEALIETAGNLVTMSNMGAMKGVLSDSDLKVLRGSQQNLSLSQSPETLIANVKELQRTTLKARKALAEKYGIPDTIPDTPGASAKSTGKSTDAILKELGVLR